jgi:anthranilate synthase/aminodeoxychorismate synthase-like glutamine amidotransferase
VILLIDNYDSFVWNLARYVGELGFRRVVLRNDAVDLASVEALAPSHIIVSPGPCGPAEAGISNSVIERFGPRLPILGVCLGHQCIGQSTAATSTALAARCTARPLSSATTADTPSPACPTRCGSRATTP